MLYALCGFANFSSVGTLLSGLSAMILLEEDGLNLQLAFGGALLASCLTGFMVGVL